MFDQLVESTSARRNVRTWVLFAWSSVFWSFVLFAVGVVGVMAYDARLDADLDRLDSTLVAQPPPPPPPPAPPSPARRAAPPAPTNALVARLEQPRTIAPPTPRPPQIGSGSQVAFPGDSQFGRPDGGPDGVPNGVPGAPTVETTRVPPQPPPPPPPVVERKEPAPRKVTLSSRVLTGKAIRRVEPKYPPLAIQASVSGDVEVEVVVDESGRVVSARAITGHPLLRASSVAAARGWIFSPTLLGEVPVKVVGTITFKFQR